MSLLPDRIQPLNDKGVQEGARYVLYWMEQSQRAQHNPALERALHHASETGLPLLWWLWRSGAVREASRRYHRCRLSGLQATNQRTADRALMLAAREGSPDDGARAYAGAAAVLVTDRG